MVICLEGGADAYGQKVASLVLWFGLDDWVIDQINSEATRTLKPPPNSHYPVYPRLTALFPGLPR